MKFEHLKENFDPLSFEPMATAIFIFNPESLHHLAALGDAGFAVLGKGLVDAYHAHKDQGLREWKSEDVRNEVRR